MEETNPSGWNVKFNYVFMLNEWRLMVSSNGMLSCKSMWWVLIYEENVIAKCDSIRPTFMDELNFIDKYDHTLKWR